ncbi:MAG: hypothetical protein AAF193_01865, partial [Bacteroidota bacterium]
DQLHGVFPVNFGNDGSVPEGLNFEGSEGMTQLIKNGEEHQISSSFQTYQMALVQKGSQLALLFTTDNEDVSQYTFQDDLLSYGADHAWALNYAGRNNGWYKYGGAQINITHDTSKNEAPDAWLVLSEG